MTKDEAIQIVAEIGRGWPKWTPTEAEIAVDWIEMLLPLDLDMAEKARKQMYSHRRTHAAFPGEFTKAYNSLGGSPSSGREDQEAGPARSGFYIQCVEAPEAFPARVGWFVELVFGADAPDNYALHRIAEKMVEQHTEIYGGRWQTVDTTHLPADKRHFEMIRRCVKLRPAHVTYARPMRSVVRDAKAVIDDVTP